MANDGYIANDDILNTNQEAVLCHTNDETCCANGQAMLGDWYFPDGTMVNSYSQNHVRHSSFFARNRGTDPPVVRLYRVGEPQERGRFRCDIRGAAGTLQELYVNICKLV